MSVLQQQSTSATFNLSMIEVPAAVTGTRHSSLAKCAVQLGCALADETVAKVNANAIAMILAMGRTRPFRTLADYVAELRKKWGAVGCYDHVPRRRQAPAVIS
jgi:hypothetical protein